MCLVEGEFVEPVIIAEGNFDVLVYGECQKDYYFFYDKPVLINLNFKPFVPQENQLFVRYKRYTQYGSFKYELNHVKNQTIYTTTPGYILNNHNYFFSTTIFSYKNILYNMIYYPNSSQNSQNQLISENIILNITRNNTNMNINVQDLLFGDKVNPEAMIRDENNKNFKDNFPRRIVVEYFVHSLSEITKDNLKYYKIKACTNLNSEMSDQYIDCQGKLFAEEIPEIGLLENFLAKN